MRRARVLIADDRRSSPATFTRDVVVEEVSRLGGLKEALATRKPAVLVVALDLPGLGGAAGIEQLRELSPATKIIAVSRSTSEREEVEVLRNGAKGYCDTTAAASMLPKAVTKVQEGEIWAGRRAIGALLDELLSSKREHLAFPEGRPKNGRQRLERLTPRESEIVRLLGDGATNKEIATALNVSVSTVKAHLTSIFRKLEQPDRLRLALYLSSRDRH